MSGVRVLEFSSLDNAKKIQDSINNEIDSIEYDDFTVDYIEYFHNRDGRLITVVLEYSDDE